MEQSSAQRMKLLAGFVMSACSTQEINMWNDFYRILLDTKIDKLRHRKKKIGSKPIEKLCENALITHRSHRHWQSLVTQIWWTHLNYPYRLLIFVVFECFYNLFVCEVFSCMCYLLKCVSRGSNQILMHSTRNEENDKQKNTTEPWLWRKDRNDNVIEWNSILTPLWCFCMTWSDRDDKRLDHRC